MPKPYHPGTTCLIRSDVSQALKSSLGDDPSREYPQFPLHTTNTMGPASLHPRVLVIQSTPSGDVPALASPSSNEKQSIECAPRIPPYASRTCEDVLGRGHHNRPSTTWRRTFSVLIAIATERTNRALQSTLSLRVWLPAQSCARNSTSSS